MSERRTADDDALIADYASFWWTQQTGETDRWEDLDAEEREAVVENSYAETVADWLHERVARVIPPEVGRP